MPLRVASSRQASWPAIDWTIVLPVAAFALMLGFIFIIQPRSMSYSGLRLLLNFSVPIVFAGLAQMCIILLGDIDLGIGPFIALVSCIAAAWLGTEPVWAILALGAGVLAYAGMGALVHLRSLPSIVVTLGASFLWVGFAILIMPRPGGLAPEWLSGLVRSRPPLVPVPVLIAVIAATVVHFGLMRSPFGVAIRGAGSNPLAVYRAGWSLLKIRMGLYAAAACFGILAGLALAGLNTTGDPNIGAPYTLLSIAAVIVGGGQFFGGTVNPIGTVCGALIMLLSGALLSFLSISTDWQLSVQGVILIGVLAARGLTRKGEA
jgi:ribose/xylose/arabinose/galactoside ABC-type transport system permease subunit